MVAIVTGSAYGVLRTSAAILGARGQLGEAEFGQRGDKVYVNASLGSLIVQQRDEVVMGRGPDASLELIYNSSITNIGRWRSSTRPVIFGLTGTVNTAGSTIMRGGGEETAFRFTWDSAKACYVGTDGAGAHDEIRFANGQYTYTDGNTRMVETYDSAGGILSIADADGNLETYTYSGTTDAKKVTVTTASGEITEIVLSLYNGAWYRPVSETSYTKNAAGTLVARSATTYGYDSLNRLTTVTVDLSPDDASVADGNVYTTTYGYEPDGYRMTSIAQSDGSNLQIQYTLVDGKYRVSSLSQTAATGDVRTTGFAYDFVNRVTTMTDAQGAVTRLYWDVDGNLTQVTYPAAAAGNSARSVSYGYNAAGDVISATDAYGNVTSYTYDANGNLTYEQDSSGNAIARSYGSKNELLTETRYAVADPDWDGPALPSAPLTARFAYDAENHLRFEISGEGRVTEYRYDTYGQQVSAIRYGGSRYNLAGLSPGTALSEATMVAWTNGIADKSANTRTDTTYDFRGNVSLVTEYGKVLATGEGDTAATADITKTTYVYDPAGRLLSRKLSTSTALETFAYDGLGRLVASTDFNGNITRMSFDGVNMKTVVTLATGATRTSLYNRAGELISSTEAATGVPTKTIDYRYDSLGRLRWSTEIGVRSYMLYDKLGRKTADILPNGRITEYVYNRNHQLIATIGYKNKLTSAQLASLVDANSNPTSVDLDSVRPAADPGDICEYRIYDRVTGLLLETVDGAGAATIYSYDGARRLIAKTAYANLIGAALRTQYRSVPPEDVDVPIADPARDRTERYFYENDDNRVGTLDAEGYLTWTSYDAVGRLTKTVRFASATATDKRASGTFNDLYQSVVNTGNANDVYEYRLYDSRSLLRATIGGEGELIRYNYSANGHLAQQVRGQKLDPAALLTTPPTLANLATAPAGTVLETTAYGRNLYGQVTSEVRTLSTGATETDQYFYNSLRQLVKTVTRVNYGDERTALQRYDARGNLIGELTGEGAAALAALGASPTTAQIDQIYRTWGKTYAYDGFDRLISKTEADGKGGANRTVYFYNMFGLVSEFNALGEAIEYRFDHFGRQSDVVAYAKRYDAATVATWTGGLSTTAANNALVSLADAANDTVTHLDYNASGTIAARVDAMGGRTAYTYNSFGEVISQADPLTATTSTVTDRTYDRRGLMLTEMKDVGGLSLETLFGYDAFGRAIQVLGPDGSLRLSGYDRSGRLNRSIDATGKITTYTYDGRGNRLTTTDRNGKTTTYTYDAFQRRLTVTTPEGIVTTTTRNTYGETLTVSDGAGRTTSYAYDRNGALISETDPLGKARTAAYDSAGKRSRETDELGVATDFTYDAADRLLTRTTTDGTRSLVTRYEYDGKGQQVKVTDAAGMVTTIAFDRNGRKTSIVVDPTGLALTTTYAYDSRGRVLTVTEPGTATVARVTQHSYDNLDRLVQSSVDPAGLNLTTRFQYDAAGNATVRTEPNNVQTKFAYDLEGRLVKTTDPLLNVTTNAYDGEGRLVTIQAGGASGQTKRFAYDGDGRLRFTLDAAGFVTENIYDGSGNIVRTVEYAASIAPAAFDASGIAAAIAAANLAMNADNRVTRTVYDEAGRMVLHVDAEGFVTETRYDAAGRIDKETRYELPYLGRESDWVRFLFQAGLGRMPDTFTWAHYTYQMRNGGLSVMGMAQVIADSAEFINNTAGLDNAGLARYMYLTAFGRAASDADVANVSAQLAAGMTRAQLIHLFTQSNELKAPPPAKFDATLAQVRDLTRTDVQGLDHDEDRITRIFRDSVGRPIFEVDGEGYVTETRYDLGGRVTSQIRYEAPYFGGEADTVRFLFQSGLGRLPDPYTWAHYTFQLKSGGMSGIGVAQAIADSDEFKNRTLGLDNSGFAQYMYQTAFGRAASGSEVAYVNSLFSGGMSKAGIIQVFTQSTELKTPPFGAYDPTLDQVRGVTQADVAGNDHDEDRTVSFVYDTAGRRIESVDPTGIRTRLVLDKAGRATDTIVAYGTADASTTRRVFDAAGRMTSETIAYGVTGEAATTTYTYDTMGNVLTIRDAMLNTTTNQWDARGLLVKVTKPLEGTTTAVTLNEYDAFRNLVKVTDPRGYATHFYYDKLNRVTLEVNAENYATETAYSVGGQPVSVKRYENKVSGTVSTAARPTLVAGAKDATTAMRLDRLDRLIGVTDAEGYGESYVLNGFGERIQVTNKLGGVTVNGYDRRGLLVAETLPIASVRNDGSTQSATVTNRYEYDLRGNRTKRTEAAGLAEQRITSWIFDKADRVTETRYPSVTIVDPANHTALSTVTPSERYRYDGRGNLIEKTDVLGARTLAYFNKADRKIVEIDALGTYSGFTYDLNGNLLTTKVYGVAVALPATPGGSPPAAPATTDFRLTTNSYDKDNRLKTTLVSGLKAGAWNGSAYYLGTVAATTYTYDAADNVIKVTDGNGGAVYSYYDKVGGKTAQLDQENYLTSWTRDAEGNALSERRYSTRFTGTPSTASPPALATTVDDRVTTFTYDRNGHRLTETRANVSASTVNDTNGLMSSATGSATVTYAYNALGRVSRKTEATTDYVEYGYDSGGRLVRESRSGYFDQTATFVHPTVSYSYNGLNDLSLTRQGGDAAAQGDRITTYYYGAGGRLDYVQDANWGIRRYFYDAAGNVLRESYDRYRANGTYATEGALNRRDLLGRVVWQTVGTLANGVWTPGDYQTTNYNAYGDVVRRGVNGLSQEQFEYDQAGRVWRTNTGDGVWRYFLYDGNGNRTLAIESEGMDLAGKAIDQVLGIATNNGAITGATTVGAALIDGINVVMDMFDKRNLVIHTRRPKRELSEGAGAVDLLSYRGYNAFGEMAWERDARTAQTNYFYNTLGRNVSIQRPTVSVTGENTVAYSATPTDLLYYDLSGRLVAIDDANGGRTTRQLLAGTGYGDAEAIVAKEFHSDGGIERKAYDVFGDARKAWDELDRATDMSYDAMGRLQSVLRPGNVSEYYVYDILGQRASTWNSILGYSATDYDAQGRVISQTAFSGDTVTTSYVWSSNITSEMGTFGGWTETTTQANGKIAVEVVDLFGHQLWRSDLGSHPYGFTYDLAGRVTSRSGGETLYYNYLNTGLVGSMWKGFGDPAGGGEYDRTETIYGYDEAGNRTSELYRNHGQYWYEPPSWPENQPYPGDPAPNDPNMVFPPPPEEGHYVPYGETYQSMSGSYDLMGRMTSWTAAATSRMPAANVQYEYDAAGNVRHIHAQYSQVAGNGSTSAAPDQDLWYRYDSMNRVVVSKGALMYNGPYGALIYAGPTGLDITYNAAGERKTVTRTATRLTITGLEAFLQREEYGYDGAGYLQTVQIDEKVGSGNWSTKQTKASYVYDGMGRLTSQTDWIVYNQNAGFQRTVRYNTKGQLYEDTSVTKRDSDSFKSVTTTNFGSGASYALGAAVSSTTINYKNNSRTDASSTVNTYQWWDGAVLTDISYDKDTSTTSNTPWTTKYTLNGWGHVSSVRINDERARTITLHNDMEGQAFRRDEADSRSAGDPREYWYRMAGRQLGYTGNNGTIETSYPISAARRTAAPGGTGAFRGGTDDPTPYADFDQNYDPINSFMQGGAGGSYTVRQGDTLGAVAASLWGDSALWYKLAEANGLGAAAELVEGQQLIIPAGVLKTANNSGTFKSYDPAETIGDTSPTTAKPPKKGRCGLFGQVLLVVIAVAVTALTSGALAAPMASVLGGTAGLIGAGAVGAAAGSIASQGFGILTGIQVTPFSLKDVAMAAIGGGVGAGVGQIGALRGIANPVLRRAATSVVGSVLTQGVAMATTLQKKFDWAGVASAAVSGAVTGGLTGRAGEQVVSAVSSAAGLLAGSAARSLQDGSDFGDNVLAGLPGLIGGTIGSLVLDHIETLRMHRKGDRIHGDFFHGDRGDTQASRRAVYRMLEIGATEEQIRMVLDNDNYKQGLDDADDAQAAGISLAEQHSRVEQFFRSQANAVAAGEPGAPPPLVYDYDPLAELINGDYLLRDKLAPVIVVPEPNGPNGDTIVRKTLSGGMRVMEGVVELQNEHPILATIAVEGATTLLTGGPAKSIVMKAVNVTTGSLTSLASDYVGSAAESFVTDLATRNNWSFDLRISGVGVTIGARAIGFGGGQLGSTVVDLALGGGVNKIVEHAGNIRNRFHSMMPNAHASRAAAHSAAAGAATPPVHTHGGGGGGGAAGGGGGGAGGTPGASPAGPNGPHPHGPPMARGAVRRITANGYHFDLDELGRTLEVHAENLRPGRTARSRRMQSRAGGADRRVTDDGGHFISVEFDPPKIPENHFAQDLNFNRGIYLHDHEDQWRAALARGEPVDVKISAGYEGTSLRPVSIRIESTINGHKTVHTYWNEHRGGR